MVEDARGPFPGSGPRATDQDRNRRRDPGPPTHPLKGSSEVVIRARPSSGARRSTSRSVLQRSLQVIGHIGCAGPTVSSTCIVTYLLPRAGDWRGGVTVLLSISCPRSFLIRSSPPP